MAEIFCNTSPLQYLYQLGLIDVLHKIAGRIIVPPAVLEEIECGRRAGVPLPDLAAFAWIEVRPPRSLSGLPVEDLGPGESQVLGLAVESGDAICILDDGLARKVADSLGLRMTGTLGILLDAKRAGLIDEVGPLLDRLDQLKFRVSARTRAAVLKLAGEAQ